ncbi:uncharacterized protein [Parasteatoda tepidariorum]|uniref:uncharacterized protein isoform X6 n=1 Tax=Parasteatoda tepidariorum TaxID=114398 RepID=UPI001C71FB67|nr:wiskott-Aldrich syndrome protein family member 1 isoform X5 [Parasteatoda tepidariorum]XP_042911188.1 wiskott-Aldrich syndrome protein family member 1 isoform X5 [Parasteatoda tepidariorum]
MTSPSTLKTREVMGLWKNFSQRFTFRLRTVSAGTKHVYQRSDAPLQIYVLSSLAKEPYTARRSLIPSDQFKYDVYAFQPWKRYVVPEGVKYVIMTVQKTPFTLDITGDSCQVTNEYDYRAHRDFKRKSYELPPPTPVHMLEEAPPVKRTRFCSSPPAKKTRSSPRRPLPPVFVQEAPTPMEPSTSSEKISCPLAPESMSTPCSSAPEPLQTPCPPPSPPPVPVEPLASSEQIFLVPTPLPPS